MSGKLLEIPYDTDRRSTEEILHGVVRFLRMLRRRKAYVLASLSICGLLGTVYYLTATRVYEGRASLLITQSGPDVWNMSVAPQRVEQALVPTHGQLFSSAVVLDGALERLATTPPAMRVDFHGLATREDCLELLRANLAAQEVRRTNIIDLTYWSKSPLAAQAVVSAVVESYLEFIKSKHRNVSAEVVKILDTERRDIENRLTARNQELLAKRRHVGDFTTGEGSNALHPMVQRVVRLNETIIEVQKQRLQLQASLAAVRDAIRSGRDLRQHLIELEPVLGDRLISATLGLDPHSADNLNSVEKQLLQDRAKLDSLRGQYGVKHPVFVQLMSSIQNSEAYLREYQAKLSQRFTTMHDMEMGQMVVAMLEEKFSRTLAHERGLRREYGAIEQRALKHNDDLAQVAMIERDVNRLTMLHNALLDRISSIDIAQNRADLQVDVVGEPTARLDPVAPVASFTAMFCLAAGLGLGALFVYIKDLLNDRFRSPEEMRDQLGLPVIALVGKLEPEANTGQRALHVHVAPKSAGSESFRTLRTTLAFHEESTDCLAITSSEPGDGKTTVLANLGVSFAQSGKKTLLIDADLRRPGLTKLLDKKGLNGLSEVLRGSDELSKACAEQVRPTGVECLDIVPSGPRPNNPAELINSSRMTEVIAWASSMYDYVLIDCPPVVAGSDAAIVARNVDALLLVVQPEKNHRRIVIRANENLAALKVPPIGIVVNHISNDGDSEYYGYGYSYGYQYGEGAEDEVVFDDQANESALSRIQNLPSVEFPTEDKNPVVPRRAA